MESRRSSTATMAPSGDEFLRSMAQIRDKLRKRFLRKPLYLDAAHSYEVHSQIFNSKCEIICGKFPIYVDSNHTIEVKNTKYIILSVNYTNIRQGLQRAIVYWNINCIRTINAKRQQSPLGSLLNQQVLWFTLTASGGPRTAIGIPRRCCDGLECCCWCIHKHSTTGSGGRKLYQGG